MTNGFWQVFPYLIIPFLALLTLYLNNRRNKVAGIGVNKTLIRLSFQTWLHKSSRRRLKELQKAQAEAKDYRVRALVAGYSRGSIALRAGRYATREKIDEERERVLRDAGPTKR